MRIVWLEVLYRALFVALLCAFFAFLNWFFEVPWRELDTMYCEGLAMGVFGVHMRDWIYFD